MAFTDNFNRADSALDAVDWDKPDSGGAALAIVSNQVATSGTLSARRLYRAPDQGSANMYAQSDVPSFTNRANGQDCLVIRAQGRQDYIFIGVGSNGVVAGGKRVANTESLFYTGSVTNPTALRIEGEGTTIRLYENTGSGMTLIHTENSVTDFQTETRAGFVTANATSGVVLWDNFETGALGGGADGSVVLKRARGF